MAAMPELVRDGETGLLCDPRDETCFISSIERLLEDPPLRRRMGDAARRHAEEHFSADRWYPRLFELLTAVADASRRRG
jgi:glycosyltransferase involved in cell wall biosynthesis